MTNVIRPCGLASLLGNDEAQTDERKRPQLRGSVRKRVDETTGWLTTERDRAAMCVKQGDLRSGIRTVFMRKGAEEPRAQRRSQSRHSSEEAPVMGVE